jgi:hypothetical protein
MTGCVAVCVHDVDDEDRENERCQNEDHGKIIASKPLSCYLVSTGIR